MISSETINQREFPDSLEQMSDVSAMDIPLNDCAVWDPVKQGMSLEKARQLYDDLFDLSGDDSDDKEIAIAPRISAKNSVVCTPIVSRSSGIQQVEPWHYVQALIDMDWTKFPNNKLPIQGRRRSGLKGLEY